MNEGSRATLIRDLTDLLDVGRNNKYLLVITPRETLDWLVVVAEAGMLRLLYGWRDVGRVWRFWLRGLRNRLSPRFRRWGRHLVHRVSLGSDPTRASQWIDEFFNVVYNRSGPFALDIMHLGLNRPLACGCRLICA
jgi:hypothetical protein